MAARYLHSTTLSCFQPPQAQDANRATAHCNGVMTFVLARVGHHSMQNQHWGLSTAFPCGRCMEACRKLWGKNLWIIPSWKHVSIYIYCFSGGIIIQRFETNKQNSAVSHWLLVPFLTSLIRPGLSRHLSEAKVQQTVKWFQWMAGWWYTYPSEKYDFVGWDDEIPNSMEKHKIPWFQSPPTSYAPRCLSCMSMSWIFTFAACIDMFA